MCRNAQPWYCVSRQRVEAPNRVSAKSGSQGMRGASGATGYLNDIPYAKKGRKGLGVVGMRFPAPT
jgi:hypothetical protein